MYNVMEISLPVSPDYYEVLYKDLTQENKEFVNSYLGKELYIDLRNSNESTIRLAKLYWYEWIWILFVWRWYFTIYI